MARRSLRLVIAAVIAPIACSAAAADDLQRATVWDLRLGQPVAAQPAAENFRRAVDSETLEFNVSICVNERLRGVDARASWGAAGCAPTRSCAMLRSAFIG